MGMDNHIFDPIHERYLENILNKIEGPINKVAWLGTKKEDISGCRGFRELHKKRRYNPEDLQMDFFDIDTSCGANYWDINGDWDKIAGYDLVVAWRVSLYCESGKHFSKQLSNILDKNKIVVFDFYSGRPVILISLLPSFIRDKLSMKFKVNVEDYYAINTWQSFFGEQEYNDYHLLPVFRHLYAKFRGMYKRVLGYDIEETLILPRSPENILMDDDLYEENIKINTDLDFLYIEDLANIKALNIEPAFWHQPVEVSDNDLQFMKYDIVVNPTTRENYVSKLLDPNSKASSAWVLPILKKQLYMISMFERIKK